VNYPTEPTTMWFDRRLVMRKSPIHNIGTFTTHDIRAGELLILVTGGIVFTPEDWEAGKVQVEPELYNQESLGENQFIVTPKAFHYYINHACEANIVDLSRSSNAVQYVAARAISAGEELTADYYTQATLDQCACGAPGCRWASR
jgi:SET domain-containing protein